jgi:hypothetical protein
MKQYPCQRQQQLAPGITPAHAYAWLSRWASSAPQFLVPPGAQHAHSGQVQGQGFSVGSVFTTKFTQQQMSGGQHRHVRVATTTMTWTVTEADASTCMVRFKMTQKMNTPGVIQMGSGGGSFQDITFQFGLGTNGLTNLNLNGTYYHDEQASQPNPALRLCPCCCCILCMWRIAAGSHDMNAAIHKAFNDLASRIHFALQASLQNGTINGGAGNMMMMQQPQGMGGIVVQPQQSTFQVQIPPNSMPGMMLTVQAPDGQQLQIQVPPGVAPGTIISVPYTPQAVVQPVVGNNLVAPVPVMTR